MALLIIVTLRFALSATLLSLDSKETYVYKEPKKAVTESLSYPINEALSLCTTSYGASMRRMKLQQTSCLPLQKELHRLGKLNGGEVVATFANVLGLIYSFIHCYFIRVFKAFD